MDSNPQHIVRAGEYGFSKFFYLSPRPYCVVFVSCIGYLYWHLLGNWKFITLNLIWVRLLGHYSLNMDSCLEFQKMFIIPILFWKVLKYSQESLMFVLRNAPQKACKIQLGLLNFIKHLSLESCCSNCESMVGIWWLWQNFNTHVDCIDMKCPFGTSWKFQLIFATIHGFHCTIQQKIFSFS